MPASAQLIDSVATKDSVTTSARWIKTIAEACAEPDFAFCNRLITRLHYLLSEAIAEAMGREGGPNFHSWAVWGSRKAGATIRQENVKPAIRNATVTSGVAGIVVGAAAGIVAGRFLHLSLDAFAAAVGAAIGVLAGGWTGRRIAIRSRGKAARLILEGNRIVLQDIGEQSARFLQLLEQGATTEARATFLAGMRLGATEAGGQDRLAAAFRSYLRAFDARDLDAKREAMIAGNCQIVYHEHIRLEPYIRGAMPFTIRRYATLTLMTYEIGGRFLTVSEDLAGIATPTAARNWAKIEQRMRYVFALFRKWHRAPEVFSMPYLDIELANAGDGANPAAREF